MKPRTLRARSGSAPLRKGTTHSIRLSKPKAPPADQSNDDPGRIKPGRRATTARPLPRRLPASQTSSPETPASLLPSISESDREELDIFTHLDADLIAYAKHRAIEPTDAHEWSIRPDIAPWIAALTKLRHDHRESQLLKALNAALENIHRIITSDAADKLKCTAVNSMVKLAHAILRGSRPSPRPCHDRPARGTRLPAPPEPGGSPFSPPTQAESHSPDLPQSLSPANTARIYQNAHLDLLSVADHHNRKAVHNNTPSTLFPDFDQLLALNPLAAEGRSGEGWPENAPPSTNPSTNPTPNAPSSHPNSPAHPTPPTTPPMPDN